MKLDAIDNEFLIGHWKNDEKTSTKGKIVYIVKLFSIYIQTSLETRFFRTNYHRNDIVEKSRKFSEKRIS